jgi:hypothetical protein
MQAFSDVTPIVPINACETVSGRYVDVVSPDPATIEFTDIAWALSRQARFAGHTMSEEVWSVAQHSIFVKDLVELALDTEGNGYQLLHSLVKWMQQKGFVKDLERRNFRLPVVSLGALMHDASEAYLIDLPSPVKRHQALREPYKELERGVMAAVYKGLALPELTPIEHELVVWADLLALRIESANLMPSRGRGWSGELPDTSMLDVHLFPRHVWNWKLSYKNFCSEFRSALEAL